MKINNILHNAALRFWLISLGLIAAVAATAAYTATDPQPTSGTVESNLVAVDLPFEFNVDNVDKVLQNTYYEENTWYKYGKKDLGTTSKKSVKCIEWKINDGIVFKIAKPGKYNVKILYYSENPKAGVWLYKGAEHSTSFDSETAAYAAVGVTKVNDEFAVVEVPFEFSTTDNNECWQVSGTDSGESGYLHSITVTEVKDTPEPEPEPDPEPETLTTTFPSDLSVITSDTFWYHNGGGGHYSRGSYDPFYRYFVANSEIPYTSTSEENAVTINSVSYSSYEIQPGDAIGFKLDISKKFRIKIYYYGVDGANAGDYAAPVLLQGQDIASNPWEPVTPNVTIIRNDTGGDTNTRLKTYEIPTGSWQDGNVFWIKNNDNNGKSLYLGGFEILPYTTANPSAETFTGTWNVADDAGDLANSNDKGKVIGDVANAHGKVGLEGPSMAINNYQIGGKKTVMINKDNTISVNIPANATLSFKYTADDAADGVLIDGATLSNDAAATSNYNKFSGHEGEVSYTNTGAARTISIKGMSANYAYLASFEVAVPGETTPVEPSIDDVTPIESDYVWYLVSGKDDFIGAKNLKTDAHTFLKKGFATNRPEMHTLYNKSQIAYRTDNSETGFKIKSGKKGVINIYYKTEDTRYLYLSEDGTNRPLTNGIISDTKPTTVARYHFDTTDGSDKTYWITNTKSAQVWFMGYEVLFDVGDTDGLYRPKDHTYNVADLNIKEIKNALSEDKYTAIGGSPVSGPAMIIRQPDTEPAVMLFNGGGERNSVKLNVSDGSKFLNITGYLDNASIRIYKGAPSSSNTAYVAVSGSGTIDKTVSLEELGEISDTYYITSDDAAGAYLTSLTVKDGSFTELQPTDVNYIYKVNGVPSTANNGVQSSGGANGRIMFIDDNSSARSNTGANMKVLGTSVTPVAIENGTDFFAVKVDQGPSGVKTGYVKVYFNGGSSASHKMEELPLDQPLYSGWNSSYDPATQTITFPGEGGGRGWWFGNEGEGARDLSAYNKINIELGKITGSPALQLVVQSANGASARFPVDSQGRLLGDLTDQSKWYANSETGTTFDITKISQIYIQDNNTDATSATVEIKSARLMNKPVVIATDTDQDPANGYTEVFGGKIYDLPDGKLYEYPFDLSKASTVPQLIWITGAGAGTTNIAAIEVLYDSNHAKVVDWYVNKDTKMIVGSDDPNFKIDFQGKTLEYPSGYDEYVTFYMSSGRQASVSFIMPEAVREIQDWYDVVKGLNADDIKVDDYVSEAKDASIAKTYGKHVIHIDGVSSEDKYGIGKSDKISFQAKTDIVYDRDNGISPTRNKIGNTLYAWYSYAYTLPANIFNSDYSNKDFAAGVSIKATQKENGSDKTETVGEKEGEWKIYMRFISFKAPEATNSSNKVSVAEGQTGKTIYYTVDSSEPENLGDPSIINDHSTTETYSSTSGVNVSGMNCIFKAAQYINTDFYFYDDISKGKDSAIGNVFKVVSRDLAIANENPSVVYVKNKTLTDDELFNQQDGGYMLTIPTGSKISGEKEKHEQAFNANPFMYLTLGGKDWPRLNGNSFELCGTNWKASDDSGLKTYLDSYQYKFDVDGVANPEWWQNSEGETIPGNQNQNPYTECNAGVGGSDTEDGGMFLQPIGGASLRFEPEYDGVITVWLRQNGCLDNNTQETGGFSRRPVYVMDENGRIMRRSTVRPTASHYMGINGTWAINSSVCEQRSQVEHTWLSEVAKKVFEDHPLYAGRFGSDYVDRWSTSGNDHSGHILYGWWYKGFDLSATRSTLNSAAHVSRYEYMEPELLYRSDGIFNMEMNRLGLTNKFAKYGYELPNFQYVRYRIPVKAGKTYYIAGRGTKNGFAAIRFDALAPNTNLSKSAMEDLRYSDNPAVIENQTQGDSYLKVTNDWDNNGARYYKSTETSTYDLSGKTEAEVQAAYDNGVTTVTFEDNGTYNSSTISNIVNDGKSGADYDTYGNLVGKTINFQLTRTFRAGNWHPIILPFSLSETRVEQYFGEGTVVLYLDPYAHTLHNQVDEATGKSWVSALNPALEGTKLSFTYHRYQMLYANTPAFICPTFTWSNDKKKPATDNVRPAVTDGAVTEITFKRVTLDGSNSRNSLGGGYYGYDISNDYEIVGSFDQTTQRGDIYYVNNTNPTGGMSGNMAELVHSENKTVNMKGFRVWIRQKDGRNAAPIKTVGSRGFSDFEEDSEMTGISDIVADDYTIEGYDYEDDSVYDLLGRKMGQGSLEGLQKGVYIFHGRKVYVR